MPQSGEREMIIVRDAQHFYPLFPPALALSPSLAPRIRRQASGFSGGQVW